MNTENTENTEQRVTSSTGGQKCVSSARFDLLDSSFLWEMAELMSVGAKKYDENNWRRGYPWSLSYGALQRHLHQFLQGEDFDEETGIHHMAAVAFHAQALFVFSTGSKYQQFDTRNLNIQPAPAGPVLQPNDGPPPDFEDFISQHELVHPEPDDDDYDDDWDDYEDDDDWYDEEEDKHLSAESLRAKYDLDDDDCLCYQCLKGYRESVAAMSDMSDPPNPPAPETEVNPVAADEVYETYSEPNSPLTVGQAASLFDQSILNLHRNCPGCSICRDARKHMEE